MYQCQRAKSILTNGSASPGMQSPKYTGTALCSHLQFDTGKVHAILSRNIRKLIATDMYFVSAAHVAGRFCAGCLAYCCLDLSNSVSSRSGSGIASRLCRRQQQSSDLWRCSHKEQMERDRAIQLPSETFLQKQKRALRYCLILYHCQYTYL